MSNDSLNLNSNPSALTSTASLIDTNPYHLNSNSSDLERLALNTSSELDSFEAIVAQFSTAAVAKPDLIISNIVAPTSAGAGNTLNLSYTIKNQGKASASASNTNFYLSSDNLVDSSDILLGSDSVSSLNTGISQIESASVSLASNLSSGSYYLLAKADGNNAIAESSETNNVRSQTITITGTPQPDLVISSLTAPTSVAAGDSSYQVNYTLTNQGEAFADWNSSYTKFYLSTNATFDASDTYLDYNYNSSSLNAGTSSAESIFLSLGENLNVGTYYLFAQADENNTIAESNEANNLRYTTFNVTKPDLAIGNLTAPSSVTGGNYLQVDYTIANQGTAYTDSNYTNLYLSTDNVLSSNDTLLDDDSIYSLKAGASKTGYFYFQVSDALTTGTYYLIAQADGDNTISELSKTNNLLSRNIYITEAPKPDLAITSLTAPSNVTAGNTLDLNFTIKNLGNASLGWLGNNTKFYLSQQ